MCTLEMPIVSFSERFVVRRWRSSLRNTRSVLVTSVVIVLTSALAHAQQ
jgi:hypothetical protein